MILSLLQTEDVMNSVSSERLLDFEGANISFDSTREREAIRILHWKFKGMYIACLMPELQKVCDYVTLNTTRTLNYGI